MHADIQALQEEIQQIQPKIQALRQEVQRVVIGQEGMIERLLIGLFSGGHILLEGLPGLAKTRTVFSLAQAIQAHFARIQFTPDMLPADLIGTNVFNPQNATFSPQKGPLFANIILADEINRAPAKVQSALLEAMQEKQVTIAKQSFPLEPPFLVLATQNPIEQEGTYPLPEAQVDRFMLKLKVGYPSKAEERKILDLVTSFQESPKIQPQLTKAEVLHIGRLIERIYIDDKIKDYIVELVQATRYPEQYGLESLKLLIAVGASPRASITLAIAAKALALLRGRGYVTPQEIKDIAPDVLRHRILVSYEAEAVETDSDQIIQTLLQHLPVP